MARYDDGKSGFGITDAFGLSEAWLQVRAMLDAGALQFPDRKAPPAMVDFFRTTYPTDQWENAMRAQMQVEDAERMLIGAVKSGQLPLWIAPVEGPIAERQVAANGLIEFGRESLIAGCYRPYNDTENLVYGYPLFVKRRDWGLFLASLGETAQSANFTERQPRPSDEKSRKGRAKGTGYQRADALLLERMRKAIESNPALNATSAAKLVASEAEGASFEAKVDRLARAFRAGRNGE